MLTRVLGSLFAPSGRNGRLSILIYHRVRTAHDPLRPDEIDADTFDRHMQVLARDFHVLDLPEAVRRLTDGSLPARAAVITFDDGYQDNHGIAMPILRRHGLSATFFVSSGFLSGGLMWNDIIIESLRHTTRESVTFSALGPGSCPLGSLETRRELAVSLIRQAKYLPQPDRDVFVKRVHDTCGAPSLPTMMMTQREVRELADAGMTVGGHTRSHPILARLDDDAARDEILGGNADLAGILGAPVTVFAYPNGRPGEDYLPQHVAMVRSAGCTAAVSTAWGCGRAGSDVYQLPRFTPWDRSALRFGLRMVGNLRSPAERRV